jgi:hypothetical protein
MRTSNFAALQGSGVAATETRDLDPFGSVELGGSADVVVSVGGEQSVVVEADDNLLENVTTRVQGGRLVIGNEGSFTTQTPMTVTITVPSIDALVLSGSGSISADEIDIETLSVRLSGSGALRANGNAVRIDAVLSGSGDVQLGDVSARDIHAVVNGSGRMVVTATDALDASVPGAGMIEYRGEPEQLTTQINGSGTIIKS